MGGIYARNLHQLSVDSDRSITIFTSAIGAMNIHSSLKSGLIKSAKVHQCLHLKNTMFKQRSMAKSSADCI
jgi:hypothetical protein